MLIRGRGSPAGPPDATSHAEQVLRRALLANCSLQILVEVELLRVLNSVLAGGPRRMESQDPPSLFHSTQFFGRKPTFSYV